MKKAGIAAAIAGVLLIAAGAIVRQREAVSIGIIGGADGPTAVFVAGDGVGLAAAIGIALGALILIAGAVILRKRRK